MPTKSISMARIVMRITNKRLEDRLKSSFSIALPVISYELNDIYVF
jgi:hypothetical protein